MPRPSAISALRPESPPRYDKITLILCLSLDPSSRPRREVTAADINVAPAAGNLKIGPLGHALEEQLP